MTPRLSLYLDALRFLAAFWVVLAHFQAWGFAPPEMAAVLPASGRDAVVLFFVLSGFVIAHTAGRKDGRSYLIDRAARIYSVAVPVVLASTAFALWGIAGGAEDHQWFYQADQILLYLGVYFSFLGSAWFLQEVPFGIIPYWSLNFEVWYYVLFGILFYMRGGWRIWAFVAVLLLVGFKLWLLWPVWLAGVWLYHNAGRWPLPRTPARALVAGTALAYLAMEASGFGDWLSQAGNAPFGGMAASPLGDARFYLSDYAVGLLAVIHLYAFRYAEIALPGWSARPVRWAAGFTFTLYLAHGPLLIFFGIQAGRTAGSLGQALLLLAGVLATVVAVGYGTERQLPAWKWLAARIVRLAERCLSPLRRHVASDEVLRLHR